MPHRHYSSWLGFITAARQPAAEGVDHPPSREASRHALVFRGTATFEQAVDLAMVGYKHGADEASKITEPLVAKVAREIQRDEPAYGIKGDVVSVSRYLQGLPNCWSTWDDGSRVGGPDEHADPFRRRMIDVVVNVAVAAHIPAETLIARGAAAAALVDLLQIAGHGVRVDTVLCTEEGGTTYELWTTVKMGNQQLDLPRLAFATGHPAMSRRLCFGAIEALGWDCASGGYGKPADVEEHRQGDVYLSCMNTDDPHWCEPDAAAAWVLRQLENQNIQLRHKESVA